MSPAPDGRLFFVEDGARVRVVMDSVLLSEPALTLENGQARIADVAVDLWSFHESRSVFVAWTETSFGATQLNVTRFREVANTLGEGVTILTGLAVPPDTPASIALDRDGLVYVAPPANDDPRSAHAGPGVVLRLTRDGLVPPTNPLGMPTVAAGFSKPASLSLDPSQPRIWLAGRNPGHPHAIVVISPSSDDVQAARLIAYIPSEDPVSLVVLQGKQREDLPTLFLVAQGRLAKASWSDDRRLTSFATLDLGEDWRLTTAAPRIGGGLYVASETSIAALVQQ
jgi:hypothetical protein